MGKVLLEGGEETLSITMRKKLNVEKSHNFREIFLKIRDVPRK